MSAAFDVYVCDPESPAAAESAAVDDPDALGERWSGGTYALLFDLSRPAAVEVGALGEFDFPAGGYAYVGSALGAGGFARVARHAAVAAGERDVRHWHVDYLSGHPSSTLRAAVLVPDRDAECALAGAFDSDPVPGFGASDCDCDSHLARGASWEDLLATARNWRARGDARR